MRTITIALCLLLLAPAVVQAQTDDELTRAIELYENGAQLYEEGQYEEAVLAWEESYRLSGEPLLIFNMANAHERLGNLEQALDYFNQYRAYATSDERETLERRIRNLEDRLETQRAEEEERQAELDRIEEERLRAEEERNRTEEQMNELAEVLEEVREPYPTSFLIMRYSLAGVAAVGLGLGIVFGSQAQGHNTDAEGLCSDSSVCPTEVEDILQSERTSALLADISFGVGGLAALGFVGTFIFGPERETVLVNEDGEEVSEGDDDGQVSMRLQPMFGASGAGLLLSGEF